MEFRHLFDYRQEVMLYGLALVIGLAGVSKFFVPELWASFEPQWLRTLAPLTANQLMYVAGALETLAGILLVFEYRIRLVAALIAVWLLSITFMLASMGLWTIALRDFGLAVLAYVVAAEDAESE